MKLRLERRRSPSAPQRIVLAGLGLSLAYALVQRTTDAPSLTCLFRAVTGIECPTCGTTRSLMALLVGDVPRALAVNPLVALLAFTGAGFALNAAAQLALGRGLVIELARAEQWVAALGFTALVGLNWLYVLVT